MANTFAPYGFRFIGINGAAAPNYAPTQRRIAQGNTTQIFRGDPVVQLNTGYITQATAGATQIAGIFDYCEYFSVSQQRTVRSNYWPANGDAAADVAAFVIDAPGATFQVVSGNGGPVVLADVGQNVNFALGAGNTTTGISGAYADFATINTTNTLPFRIYNFAGNTGYVVGDGAPQIIGNGSDGTTPYNTVYVTFNNQDYKVLTGI